MQYSTAGRKKRKEEIDSPFSVRVTTGSSNTSIQGFLLPLFMIIPMPTIHNTAISTPIPGTVRNGTVVGGIGAGLGDTVGVTVGVGVTSLTVTVSSPPVAIGVTPYADTCPVMG